MSTDKKKLIKSIKTISINKKNSSNFQNLSTVSNDSMVIRTNNNIIYNNYNRSSTLNMWKNNLSRIYNSKYRVQSAQINYKPKQISKSTITMEKKNINKFYDYINNSNFLYNDNKENKLNQVSFIFNNSVLNNYYINKPIKVNNYFLKLNKFYNPHYNYFRIVKNEKSVIKELISQTKNNFNNNYKLKYLNPDPKKRKKILKWFNIIRENKRKNIDSNNPIEIIAIKSLSKNNKKKRKNDQNIIKINKQIAFPSSFNIKNVINKSDKVKIKTMKITDEIIQENYKTLSDKNQEIIRNPLEKYKINNRGEKLFKTVPKNDRNINNDNYYEYSKTSSFDI